MSLLLARTGSGINALRFNSAADTLIMPSAALPASTGGWTLAGWFRIVVDRNTEIKFWSMDAVFSSGWHSLATSSDGTTLIFNGSGSALVTGPNLTVGQWYFIAVRKTAANALKLYVGTEAGGALSTYTGTANAITSYAGDGYVGGNAYSEYLDGREWGLRLWDSDLSDTEVDAEFYASSAIRTSNLRAQWLLDNAATPGTDTSGNGRTLTNSGGSWTVEAGPVLPAAPPAPLDLTDIIVSSDSSTNTLIIDHSVSDIIISVDSLTDTLFRLISENLTDTIISVDSSTGVLILVNTLVETIVSSDTLEHLAVFVNTPTDTIVSAESSGSIVIINNTTSDNLISSDTIVSFITGSDSNTDTIVSVDSNVSNQIFVSVVDDTALLTDQILAIVVNNETRTDTIVSVDSLTDSILSSLNEILFDVITSVDSSTAVQIMTNALVDILISAETLSQTQSMVDSRSENIISADFLSSTVLITDSKTDIITSIDQQIANILIQYQNTDTIISSDSLDLSVIKSHSITDTVNTVDSLLTSTLINNNINEVLVLVDSNVATVRYNEILNDVGVTTDTVNGIVRISYTISDTGQLVDQVIVVQIEDVNELLNTIDSIVDNVVAITDPRVSTETFFGGSQFDSIIKKQFKGMPTNGSKTQPTVGRVAVNLPSIKLIKKV